MSKGKNDRPEKVYHLNGSLRSDAISDKLIVKLNIAEKNKDNILMYTSEVILITDNSQNY